MFLQDGRRGDDHDHARELNIGPKVGAVVTGAPHLSCQRDRLQLSARPVRSFVMFKLSLYSLPPCLFSHPCPLHSRRFLGQAQISISLPEAIFTPAPVLRHGAPVNKIRNQQRRSQETFEIFFMSPHWVHTFLAEKEQLVDFPPMRIMMR